jgi:hypothetical protein
MSKSVCEREKGERRWKKKHDDARGAHVCVGDRDDRDMIKVRAGPLTKQKPGRRDHALRCNPVLSLPRIDCVARTHKLISSNPIRKVPRF